MAIGINGTLTEVQGPNNASGGGLNRARNFTLSWANIHSANQPLVHSVIWNSASYPNLDEAEEALASNWTSSGGDSYGDVVNVIFEVYQCIDSDNAGLFPDDWSLVSSIRKSRDIRNISDKDKSEGGDGIEVPLGHTFTVDISEVCRDLLSYSLLPHGKGTYTNWRYGGLNGGARRQDNLAQNVWTNNFIVSKNGAYRKIQVRYKTEVIDSDGVIREANKEDSMIDGYLGYFIINSAPDYDNNLPSSVYGSAALFMQRGWGASSIYPRQAQSLCPNYDYVSDSEYGIRIAKDVRMNENNEVLYWNQQDINNNSIWQNSASSPNPENLGYNSNNTSDLIEDTYMKVSAYDSSGVLVRTARLYDWNQCLRPRTDIGGGNGPDTATALNVWPRKHFTPLCQNVSPVFINANCIHESSPVLDIWENGGTTYTRYRIDTDGVTASPEQALFLNDEIAYYSISGTTVTTTQGNGQGVIKNNLFEYRWYKIDRDRERSSPGYRVAGGMYAGIYYTELRTDFASNSKKIRCKGLWWKQSKRPYVRIYWLNKAGGIDAYTFKGDAKVSYESNKDVILRTKPNRFAVGSGISQGTNPRPYPSDNAPTKGNYQSDTLRDANVYNGGLEVLNVDSTKRGSVMSLPLNEEKADWLREIISSPSVWTEHETVGVTPDDTSLLFKTAYRSISNIESGDIMDGRHPSNMEYSPIIITNSSVDIYDDAQGLVTMEIEYTHAHAVVTQRN